MGVEIYSPNVKVAAERFRRAPRVAADLIEKNLRSLGKVIAAKERRVLDVVKYRGTLARSISTRYEAAGGQFSITIGPALPDKHGFYVFYGTKPHTPPIGPLKEWARWKLGDEGAAYAVQRSIARHGTSTHIEKLGLGDGHGGYNFVQRTLSRPDVQQGIARTAARIPIELLTFVESGQVPGGSTAGEG